MASIHELLAQVQDEALRARLEEEVKKLSKQKKFGLVFEEHLPECTPLYGISIKRGSKVARSEKINETYTVIKVDGDNVVCVKKNSKDAEIIPVAELVPVAEFGDPIYPCLQPIDSVCNAPDSDLWHTLIEADNYHALQLLEYLYAGKVDCIYIDPPYNTGARDWKYNNDYVDSNDSYRHSKWLSMMQKRLKIAKKLLNPKDSVLIVTIDEKEYHHLACLLEEMFPEARMQMISSLINITGVANDRFGRTDEYIFIIYMGSASPEKLPLESDWIESFGETTRNELHWNGLMRTGSNNMRSHSPGCFYPIYVADDASHIVEIGDALPLTQSKESVPKKPNCITCFPIHLDNSEGCWRVSGEVLKELLSKGFVKLGGITPRGVTIMYLAQGERAKIENGEIPIVGYQENGTVIVDDSNYKAKFVPGSQWRIRTHDATRHGTGLINSILGNKVFSYPKSLYAVHDAIRFFVENKPNALIIDFFAGSGTTLHAVNLLNAEDGGKRRCIMVTNNEVSDAEAKEMKAKGLNPGDEEWEKLGIARHVTWPRTVCAIEGHDIKGKPLKGKYIGSDIPMADGFKANAAFFKLGFLDKNAVALGRQFKEMLPTLWMKAGAKGKCPEIGEDIPSYLIFPENRFAVLVDEKYYMEFSDELDKHPKIETIFIITDSESGYRDMISGLDDKETYQLYRDYLDNFRINTGR